MTKKWCNGCARFLVPSEFWRNSFMPDGLQQWCKSCIRAWRYANREIEREHDRARVLKKPVYVCWKEPAHVLKKTHDEARQA